MAMKTVKFNGKTYRYSEAVAKKLEDKHFLGHHDAIEIAVNKQLARARRARERKKK